MIKKEKIGVKPQNSKKALDAGIDKRLDKL